MSATLLATELTNLSSEAKRKNNELRNAADKSLQELKAIQTTSEQQLAADLSRRPTFIEPFLKACATRNARFAGSGVVCLQRLVISKGLPKSRLHDALEAFNACTDLGLDVQLKILQALPSLLQNYAEDLKGDLLSIALQVCSSLQSAKAQTVSGVATATFQQLVTTVFEKVAAEDRHASEISTVTEVPGDQGSIALRPAAYDAYRVFRDLALAAEDRKTKYVQFSSLSQESSLELIWSCINANPRLCSSHPELGSIIRSNVLPFTIRTLSEKTNFMVALRSLRILDLVIGRSMVQFLPECEVAIGLATQALDNDAVPAWKRAMVMEMLRNFFSDGSRIIDAYSAYDMADGGKPVVQDMMAVFVRLSAEKPALIGLGQQSTVPLGPNAAKDSNSEQATVEAAGGMAGVISSTLGVAEINVAGISSQWSVPRTSWLEQLDKSDPPAPPETYIYVLVLECLNSLSEGLAKMVLPLTVPNEKRKTQMRDEELDGHPSSRKSRSQSFRKRTVAINPLDLEDHTAASRIHAAAGIVESCWPAVLATSSTFLNSALDDQYYRNLIKAFQRFAQVAGLLKLGTARDALMTTLGKAAVPPHVLNTTLAEPPKSPSVESPRVFSNPKNLLSVESLVSQASTDRDRRGSAESLKPMLTARNLLCLRALLNLAIALGPTLDTAFAVIVDTLRQADMVLSSISPQQMVSQGLSAVQKQTESPAIVQAFSNEVAAVEAAASRLLQSTADYPNDAFLNVLNTLCRLLHGKDPAVPPSPQADQTSNPSTPLAKTRSFSGLPKLIHLAGMQLRDYKFVIPKLGSLAELNIARFVSNDPSESGWNILVEQLIALASDNSSPKEARHAATDVLCKVAAAIIAEVAEDESDMRGLIQRRALAVLLRLVDSIYAEDGELTSSDVDVQGHVMASLRAILERSGESLIAGWNRTIAIVGSIFEHSGASPGRPDDEEAHIDWTHVSSDLVSVGLGRTAFSATQLICSDFLSALPKPVLPSLIELLYRFAGQSDDLNTSLTTITMVWNVSDFLLSSISDEELESMATRAKDADSVIEEVEAAARDSSAAQWLLLLFRLQDIIKTTHKEVRKAAFQILCSIFKNQGDQLSPKVWELTLRHIILKVAANDVAVYHRNSGTDQSPESNASPMDDAMSSMIVSGTSDIISQHLRTIEQVAQLPSLWEAFLGRLEAYLDVQGLPLSASVYQALSKVLARVETDLKTWTSPLYRTLAFWLKRSPVGADTEGAESNQEVFTAYVEAGIELYRLTQQSMSVSQTRTLVENLYMIVRQSDGPRYLADVNSLSPLQAKTLELLKNVRSDAPSTLVIVAAKFVTLHHEMTGNEPAKDRPTFVSISNEAVDWLQDLVTTHFSNEDLLETGDFVTAIQSLEQLIREKYIFKAEHKGLPLWRKATAAAITLSRPLLEQCRTPGLDKAVKISMWTGYAQIASGIINATGLKTVEDKSKVYADQLADIESFKTLRDILIPRIGDPDLPDDVRLLYTRALFNASIIHPTEDNEIPGPGVSPLTNIGDIRRGRVKRVPYSERERMCYECLSELVVLSSKGESSPEQKKLAQAAAPLLILRLAIPIRAYIADQFLRGRRPQPLSELEELLFCFDTIKTLECDPDALAADPVATGRTGAKVHLHYLSPLLAKAVGSAGDKWSGSNEVLAPLQSVLEAASCNL